MRLFKIFILMMFFVSLTTFANTFADSNKIENITVTESQSVFNVANEIFTLNYNGQQKSYSLQDLQAFESITGTGGRIRVTGSVSGPYEYTGVPIFSLIEEFSPHPETFDMVTISKDGYTVDFSYDQIKGNVMVYDEHGNELGIGSVTMILAYAEDDEPLIHGGPLRIAWVNDDDAITDAFLWPKMVDQIEFFPVSTDETAPQVSITKPENAIYLFDSRLFFFPSALIIGDITIEAMANDAINDIAKMMLIIDEVKVYETNADSFQWNWNEQVMDSVTIQVIAYDSAGNVGTAEKTITMYNPF